LISSINVTPLVDITLVLLLIAMVTSRVVDTPAVPLDLPQAVRTQQVQLVLAVTLPLQGPLRVNGQPVDPDEALLVRARRERQNDPSLRAVIQADGGVPHRRVLHVLDLLRQAGLSKVAFGAIPAPVVGGPSTTGLPR
jgi:biopolymer transport protein ExbD